MNKLPAKFKLAVTIGYEKFIQEKLIYLGIFWKDGMRVVNLCHPFLIIEDTFLHSCDFKEFMKCEYEEIKLSDLINIQTEKNKDNSFIEILQKCQNRFDEDDNYYSDGFIKDLAVEIQKEIDRRIEKAIRENKGE